MPQRYSIDIVFRYHYDSENPPAQASKMKRIYKFQLRFADEQTRDEVAAHAEADFISMNSFILQAIAEKLDRCKRVAKQTAK